MEEHDWHLFDADKGLEALRFEELGKIYYHIRKRNRNDTRSTTLSEAEFDQLRSNGPNPPTLPDWLS